MLKVTGRGIRTKWKTQETTGAGLGELKVGLHAILTRTAPCLAGEVGCVRGQALPCTEGATGSRRRIFPQKKKTLWGTLETSLAATAPVCSPPGHSPVPEVCTSTGDCVHLISEGAETTDITPGQDAQQPGVCLSTGDCPHLISEGTETIGITGGVCPATWECPHLISEGAETTGTTPGKVRSKFGVSAPHL